MQALQDEQEIMGAIANMTIETYAMESAVLRVGKMVARLGETAATLPIAMTRVYLMSAMDRVESAAKIVLAAASEGDLLRTHMAILRRLCKYEPFNSVALATSNCATGDRSRKVRLGLDEKIAQICTMRPGLSPKRPRARRDRRAPRSASQGRVPDTARMGCATRGRPGPSVLLRPLQPSRPPTSVISRSYRRSHVTFMGDPRHGLEPPQMFKLCKVPRSTRTGESCYESPRVVTVRG